MSEGAVRQTESRVGGCIQEEQHSDQEPMDCRSLAQRDIDGSRHLFDANIVESSMDPVIPRS